MSLEGFQTYVYPIIDIFAILTVVFAVRTIFVIRKKEEKTEIKKILERVFILLAVGYVLWAIAEIAWDIHSYFVKDLNYSIFADPFWVIGYFPVIAGFTYFSYTLFKANKQPKKGLFALLIVIAISILLYFIISTSIAPYVWDEGVLLGILGLFYPIASAVAMMSALAVFLFFSKARIRMPLLLLAIALFFSFAGDMLFTYAVWNELGYGVLGVIYDTFYLLEYIIATFAFYLLSRKRGERKIEVN